MCVSVYQFVASVLVPTPCLYPYLTHDALLEFVKDVIRYS